VPDKAGIKAVLEGRAEGFRQLVASAGGNASEAVVVLVADQLPALVDSQNEGDLEPEDRQDRHLGRRRQCQERSFQPLERPDDRVASRD
jgi:hypothetical protein